MQINERIDYLLDEASSKGYNISYIHHIDFWLIYFTFNTLRWGSVHDDLIYSLKTNLIGFPIHIALSYFNVYYLMPKFVYNKKYLSYTILVLVSLVVMLLVKFNLTYFLIDTNVMPEAPEVVNSLTLNYAVTTMLGELYVVSFVTAIKITDHRIKVFEVPGFTPFLFQYLEQYLFVDLGKIRESTRGGIKAVRIDALFTIRNKKTGTGFKKRN